MNELEHGTDVDSIDCTLTMPILKPVFEQQTPATPKVEVFDNNLKKFAEELLIFARNCENPPLAGLAANQLAFGDDRVMINMCVVMQNSILPDGSLQDSGKWIVAVNPEIHKHTENKEWGREGCLTWPGKVVEAERYLSVSIKYQDLDGNELHHGATDFEAAVWQHEINHLHGVKERVVHPKTGKLYGNSLDNGGTIVNDKKVGRNDPCPYCLKNGINRKWKKCHEHNIE